MGIHQAMAVAAQMGKAGMATHALHLVLLVKLIVTEHATVRTVKFIVMVHATVLSDHLKMATLANVLSVKYGKIIVVIAHTAILW